MISLATADNAEMPISKLSLLLLLVLLLANIYLAHGQLLPSTCTNLAKSTFQTYSPGRSVIAEHCLHCVSRQTTKVNKIANRTSNAVYTIQTCFNMQ